MLRGVRFVQMLIVCVVSGALAYYRVTPNGWVIGFCGIGAAYLFTWCWVTLSDRLNARERAVEPQLPQEAEPALHGIDDLVAELRKLDRSAGQIELLPPRRPVRRP